MCVLCGELITNVHWTDQGGTVDANGFQDQRERRRSRIRKAKYINRVLAFYGLSISDWNGTKYTVADKKGATVIVQDLGDLWPAAQRMTSRRIDPLSPELIAYLAQADESGA